MKKKLIFLITLFLTQTNLIQSTAPKPKIKKEKPKYFQVKIGNLNGGVLVPDSFVLNIFGGDADLTLRSISNHIDYLSTKIGKLFTASFKIEGDEVDYKTDGIKIIPNNSYVIYKSDVIRQECEKGDEHVRGDKRLCLKVKEYKPNDEN